MFNSNIWPNSGPLQDIRLRNVSDLEFDLSRSLKVKCDDFIGLAIHGFLLTYTVITCQLSPLSSHSHSQCILLSLIIGPKLRKIASAPNDLKMSLNAKRPKVPLICWRDFLLSFVVLRINVYMYIHARRMMVVDGGLHGLTFPASQNMHLARLQLFAIFRWIRQATSQAIMSCPVRRCEKRVYRLAGDRSSG